MEALGRTRASVAYRLGPVKPLIEPVVRYGNSMTAVGETGLWRDMREAPGALRTTLERAAGFGDVAAFLTRPGAGRIVLTGNGAAYYAGLAVWLAALDGVPGPELTAVPSGVLLTGRFAWREDDALLVISSSGELRDVIEVLAGDPRPYALISADARSTLARGAEAVALQHVESQRAVTHTQAFVGEVAAGLAVWALAAADAGLRKAVADAPGALDRSVAAAEAWVEPATSSLPDPAAAIALGSGSAWAGAAEAALLLKEIARIPAEGAETREGATSAMFGLTRAQHLAVTLRAGPDALLDEAERLCAAAGATVVRCPADPDADPRLAAITSLPATAALAGQLALRGGHDVDRPTWTAAYYETARVSETPAGPPPPAPRAAPAGR
jgi:fructoselysine-6-P-deglycase FrlB-like protein